MGRITLFTKERCMFSLRLKHELESRNLPYNEINITRYPSRREDMHVLTLSRTTPQAFFNTRYVGGYDATLKELKHWDKDKHYANALEKYQKQIEGFPDPKNTHLMLPEADEEEKEGGTVEIGQSENFYVTSTQNESKTVSLDLPAGPKIFTIWELTELLIDIFPLSNLHFHLVTYKNSVRGDQATAALAGHFQCTSEQAVAIGQELLNLGLLHHVTYGHDFSNTRKFYYRLQTHQTPHILNSLYLTGEEAEFGHDTEKAEALVLRIARMLEMVTRSCLQVDAKNGGICYKQGSKHALFQKIQEDICHLQSVFIDQMEPKTLLAFGLNVYMIMIQFAFFKIGFPILESHQEAFLEGVEFNIGGTVYSFNQWLGAISGGNIGEEPDLQGSQRKSLLVPKRPMLNPNLHISVDSDTSESFSSEHSSKVRTARTSLKSSPDCKRKTKRTSTKQGISIADYRLYFATHSFGVKLLSWITLHLKTLTRSSTGWRLRFAKMTPTSTLTKRRNYYISPTFFAGTEKTLHPIMVAATMNWPRLFTTF